MRFFGPLRDAALALLYPARCAACDTDCDEGAAFCDSCGETLLAIEHACGRCGLPLPGLPLAGAPPPLCLGCVARPPPYASAWAPFQFGGALAQAIRRMKWAGLPELARPLARLLAGRFAPAGELVVPVPLHPRRLREREFNQAALLALDARRAGAAPEARPRVVLDALERIRDTPPQSALGVAERRANVREAFCARPERVRGRSVTLVDDVMTTGATAEACAVALLDAGAAEVRVLTVARAVT